MRKRVSDNIYERTRQVVMFLERLEGGPQHTRALLQNSGEEHQILKYCEKRGLIIRERKGQLVINELTEKGRKLLHEYQDLAKVVA